MRSAKFINLNYKSTSSYTEVDYDLPKGKYINEWEITFKRDTTVARKAEVLTEILNAVYNNNYGDHNKVSAIEYEWCRWSNSPIKYTLYVYRIVTPMEEEEKAAFDKLKVAAPRTLMAEDDTATAAMADAADGGPQPSGPVLPPPPGVDSLLRKDLVPVTDPPADE
jgi:hypothetical protein